MFLKLNKDDFSRSRCKKALPLFLLLWLGEVVLATIYLLVIHSHFRALERLEAENLLETYLTIHHLPFLETRSRIQAESLFPELAFIRVVQDAEQLIIIGKQLSQQSLKKFVELPPTQEGVWLHLGEGEKYGVFTVISRKVEDGGIIQAGKDGQKGYALFCNLLLNTVAFIILSTFLLWPLSLLFIRQSLLPLIKTRRLIGDHTHSPAAPFLPEEGNGRELDGVYQQINKVIRQNRHLIAEMQQSLDNVAHDLRTPMTRLRSIAEFGLQANTEQQLRDALSDCLEESERVLAMLRVMMSVAEAESGTLRLERERFDIYEILNQVAILYEYVAEERRITLQVMAGEPLLLWADKTRIAQVFANLVDNAIKYGKEGGWVRLESFAEGEVVIVTIVDNGIGISESEQARIWDRLFRGDRSRSQKGLGLGLNFVRAVVEAHGGSVSVSSVLHEGSKFVVRLPMGQLKTHEKSQMRGE